jgi:hypothetical protein
MLASSKVRASVHGTGWFGSTGSGVVFVLWYASSSSSSSSSKRAFIHLSIDRFRFVGLIAIPNAIVSVVRCVRDDGGRRRGAGVGVGNVIVDGGAES